MVTPMMEQLFRLIPTPHSPSPAPPAAPRPVSRSDARSRRRRLSAARQCLHIVSHHKKQESWVCKCPEGRNSVRLTHPSARV